MLEVEDSQNLIKIIQPFDQNFVSQSLHCLELVWTERIQNNHLTATAVGIGKQLSHRILNLRIYISYFQKSNDLPFQWR